MLVAIIGPDGCGKTTIAKALGDQYTDLGFEMVRYRECNFNIIPQLKYFKKILLRITGKIYVNKYGFEEGEYLGGMKNKPNTLVKSLVLFFWYLFDYSLGSIQVKRWNRRNCIVIFTRYYYEYYFQRVHQNLPNQVSSMFEFLVPKPDLIIFLEGDAERIFDRKPELSMNEIDRQNQAILDVLQNRDNFFIVDTRGGVDQTVAAVIDIVRASKSS